jgi:hypothetical protein
VDVTGFVVPWSAFSILGVVGSPSRIDPGYRGKLALGLVNLSGGPLEITAGQRVASVSLFRLDSPDPSLEHAQPWPDDIDMLLDMGILSPELKIDQDTRRITRTFRAGEMSSLTSEADRLWAQATPVETPPVSTLLSRATNATDSATKGRLLEELAERLVATVDGFDIVKRDARSSAEEIDLLVRNEADTAFLRSLGTPLIVECKNWSSPVGAPEITVLAGKMAALSPDVRTAVLVAPKGVTGDQLHDAQLRRREHRQSGRYIMVVDGNDLARLAAGRSFAKILEEKHDELYLI